MTQKTVKSMRVSLEEEALLKTLRQIDTNIGLFALAVSKTIYNDLDNDFHALFMEKLVSRGGKLC